MRRTSARLWTIWNKHIDSWAGKISPSKHFGNSVWNVQLGGQAVACTNRCPSVTVLASSFITQEFGEASIFRAASDVDDSLFRNSAFDCNVLATGPSDNFPGRTLLY